MQSKQLVTANLHWQSPLTELTGKRPSPTVSKLMEAGITSLYQLLWILPLRIHPMPVVTPFREALIGQYFKGSGKVIHAEVRPAFGRRKGKFLLYQGMLIVKDLHSSETLTLRWFNLYPTQKKQIESLEQITFLGQIQDYKSQKQVINPQIINDGINDSSPYILEYPTMNKISGNHLKKIFGLIPRELWNQIPQNLPELGYDKPMTLGDAMQIIHGKLSIAEFTAEKKNAAEERLIYEEFLVDQLKLLTRRIYIKKKDAPIFKADNNQLQAAISGLPFKLTEDQLKVLTQIQRDFTSGHPMMRMVQGDVGCGKTIVAILASQIAIRQGYQVALMCPTEALALQHLESFRQLNTELTIDILLGSSKVKEKREALSRLQEGKSQMIIGTHSLFQDSVEFNKLGLAIIDEQHKFGVEQRLKLIAKGTGVHCLIMTATPIPRTLSLAQYGDLDISSIKTMPLGRKGIKTRITEKINYCKYVEFVKARLSQGEQAYFVFPAIEESEVLDLQNVTDGLKKYQAAFKGFRVEMLHGKMKSEEKDAVVAQFRAGKINILVSTSVIEVGINIPNATIMSIYNPERFGLSSLHQLRGRVGRGEKSGFCFLVLDKEISPEAYQRLQVIESTLDGFVIAEEDLKFRGEGDLFGVDQSGTVSTKKLANFVTHSHILEQVVNDLEQINTTRPELLDPYFERLAKDQKILDTV